MSPRAPAPHLGRIANAADCQQAHRPVEWWYAQGSSTSSPSQQPPSNGSTITFKETEYSIAPATRTLKAGSYTVDVQNVGQFPHDLHVATSDGSEVGGSTVVMAGHTTSFTVTLRPGTYTIWCAVDAHRSLGMQGTITVR